MVAPKLYRPELRPRRAPSTFFLKVADVLTKKTFLALVAFIVTIAPAGLSAQQKELPGFIRDLIDNGEGHTTVPLAIIYQPGGYHSLEPALTRHHHMAKFRTVLIRTPAETAEELASRPEIQSIEGLSEGAAARVLQTLEGMLRAALYHDLGIFRPQLLTFSIGSPRLIVREESGHQTIRHAVNELAHRGPVIMMAAGNSGPAPGQVNFWSLVDDVFVIGAADQRGQKLWDNSARFNEQTGIPNRFFVAHGVDVTVPHSLGIRKSEEMLAAEQRVHGHLLPANMAVVTGTSLAVPSAANAACPIHQATAWLQAIASGTSPLEMELPKFIRGYVDTPIDASLFPLRLADRAAQYGGMAIEIEPERRALWKTVFADNAIDLFLRFDADVVERYFLKSAKLIPGAESGGAGRGFVSVDGIRELLLGMSYRDLPYFYAPSGPGGSLVLDAAVPQTVVFTPEEVGAMMTYCKDYSLILALPLHD
jgi:Subtilase family